MVLRVCSIEVLIEPDRRCFSREMVLIRREKYRELAQKSGATTSETRASVGSRMNRAMVKITSSRA